MLDIITLECPSCGGRTEFSADTEVLICQYCGNKHLFRLPNPTSGFTPSAMLGKPNPPALETAIADQGADRLRPRPKEVTLEKQGDRLEITWRWFSWKFIPLALFCLVWDGFLCFWYSIALSDGAPWIFIVFPIAHLAVGVGMTYYTLAGFLNSSRLVVDRKNFAITHGPLPWLGELRVPVNQVEQLYCKEKPGRGDSSTTYQMSVILKDGRKKDLLSNLDSPEVGFYIEHKIENWLNIPDRPVRGEISRDTMDY